MNLRMIGRFKSVGEANRVEGAINRLRLQLEADGLDVNSDAPRRYTDAVSTILSECDFYSASAEELDQLLFDFTVDVEGANVNLRTEEADVSVFIKLMLAHGARIEVYSAHDYPDAGVKDPTDR